MKRWALVCLLLAGCQAPPPVTRLPTQAAPPRPAPVTPVEGAWSFTVGAGNCTARITHAEAALNVSATREGGITFGLRGTANPRGPGRSGRLAFTGPDGAWRLPAATGQGGLRASLPLDDLGETRLRQLLGGGTLSVPGARQPPLRFPEAGISGREWFGCVANLRSAS